MIRQCKRLLIPLCHAFILLPLAALMAGSPGTGALALLLAALFGLGAVGWLVDWLLPRSWHAWIPAGLLMAAGVGMGYGFLPGWFVGISGGAAASWMAPVFGLMAGAVMAWSQLECRRGLALGLEPYKIGVGLALYVLTYFSYRTTGLYTAADKSDLIQPIFLYGVIWLLLGLLVVNYQYVTRMAVTKSQPQAPRAVLAFNIGLVVALALSVIFVTSLGFLRRLFMRLLGSMMGYVGRFFAYVSEHMGGSSSGGGGASAGMDMPEGFADYAVPEWARIATSVLVLVLGIAILLVALFVGVRKLRELIRELRAWLGRKLNRWQQQAPAYLEEEENLMGWSQLKKEMGQRIRRRRPRTKLEDQPDERAKVRWLYARLREQMVRNKVFDGAKTPRETAQTRFKKDPRVQRLLEDYNEARYSDHPIDPESVTAGQEALRRMRL